MTRVHMSEREVRATGKLAAALLRSVVLRGAEPGAWHVLYAAEFAAKRVELVAAWRAGEPVFVVRERRRGLVETFVATAEVEGPLAERDRATSVLDTSAFGAARLFVKRAGPGRTERALRGL